MSAVEDHFGLSSYLGFAFPSSIRAATNGYNFRSLSLLLRELPGLVLGWSSGGGQGRHCLGWGWGVWRPLACQVLRTR